MEMEMEDGVCHGTDVNTAMFFIEVMRGCSQTRHLESETCTLMAFRPYSGLPTRNTFEYVWYVICIRAQTCSYLYRLDSWTGLS